MLTKIFRITIEFPDSESLDLARMGGRTLSSATIASFLHSLDELWMG